MKMRFLWGSVLLALVMVIGGCKDGSTSVNPKIQGKEDPNLKPTSPSGAPGGSSKTQQTAKPE
jgi:hypothetical protein